MNPWQHPEDDSTPVHVTIRCPNPATCVRYKCQHAHNTKLYAQTANCYHFETIFSSWKCEAILNSSWHTGIWLWSFIPSSQKLNSPLKIQVISVSKLLSFQQFSMVVARCYNRKNLNTSAMHDGQDLLHPLDSTSMMSCTHSCPL